MSPLISFSSNGYLSIFKVSAKGEIEKNTKGEKYQMIIFVLVSKIRQLNNDDQRGCVFKFNTFNTIRILFSVFSSH